MGITAVYISSPEHVLSHGEQFHNGSILCIDWFDNGIDLIKRVQTGF